MDQTHPSNAINAAPCSRLPAVVSAVLALGGGLAAGGLALAMLGLHHAWLHGPLALAVGWAVWRVLPHQTGEAPIARPVMWALALLIVAVTASNYALRSELVTTGRDGATYANTASFLVEGSNLFPRAVAPPFQGADLEFDAPGFVLRDDGTLWQQFLHSTPTVYAFAGEVFGKSALFGVNAFVSGGAVLVLFALARRFMSQWWALLAVTVIAASLPFAYYSRATFSEMMTLLFAMGGLWAGHIALDEQPGVAFGAGLLLGATTMTRVDGWMVGVSLGLLMVLNRWMGDDAASRVDHGMFNGFALSAALGLVDLIFYSEPYLIHLGELLLSLIALAVLLRFLVPAAASGPARRLMEWVRTQRRPVTAVVTVLLVAAVLYIWVIRPLLPYGLSGGGYGITEIQVDEGLPIEPRDYREETGWWLVWYLGIPVVAAGIIALIAGARRTLQEGTAPLRLAVLTVLVPAAVYLVRPSINPDHIWAIRRFLPVVVPGVVIAGFAWAAWAVGRLPDRGWGRFLAGAIVAAGLIPVVAASAPLIDDADRAGVEAQLTALCDSLGEAGSVLIVDDDPDLPLSWQIGPPLRSWCGLSVAGVEAGSDAADGIEVDRLMAATADLAGRDPTQHVLTAEAWRPRLTGAPNRLETRTLTVWVGVP